MYEPLHPAILRLIRHIRRAAAKRKVPLSVCGEMASDPAMLALLVGMGLVRFSMTPAAIPVARQVIQEMDTRELRVSRRSRPQTRERARDRAVPHRRADQPEDS